MWKNRRQEQLNMKRISYGLNESRSNFDKDLRHMDNTRNFDQNIFNKGEEWYNSGLSLESADPELKKNLSFIKGFNRGVRINTIKNKISDTNKRGR